MTDKKTEVLKMALKALEEIHPGNMTPMAEEAWNKAITAIRKALAEQQEPVAWHHPECEGQCIACLIEQVVQEAYGNQGLGYLQRHLTSPPAKPWVNPSIKEYEDIMLANLTPRTDDERDGIMGALNDMVGLLKEKNHD
jgi:hypothetical protein